MPQHRVHALHVIGVHVFLVRIGNARRLLVGALTEAYAAPKLDGVLDVGESAIQIALQHDADVRPKQRIQPMLEEVQRTLGVLTRLHVDADERPVLLSASEHLVHQADAQLLRDVEPHGRELDGDIRVEPLHMDAIENLEVCVTRSARLALVGDTLAEQVERHARTASSALSSVSPATKRLANRFARPLFRTNWKTRG